MSSARTEMDEWRVGPSDWEGALADTGGPQLVVAGPGTGKTEFLVRRTLHLIHSGEAAPAEMLLLTFSRRAAADLRRRVEDRLDRSTTTIPASTFHSFAYRMLEAHAPEALGWEAMPSLLTGPEQVMLVAELLRREDPERWPLTFRPLLHSSTLAGEVADFLLRCRERLIDRSGLSAGADHRPDWRALPGFLATYEKELERRRRIDYGTLQAQAVWLLEHPEVQAAVGLQYRYVLVDEYQDTTAAQARLLELVTAAHRNLTAAADPYQSVYSFRGAELHNVSEFPDRFRHADGRPARRLVLTTSFRVPGAILAAAELVTAGGHLPGASGPVEPAPHAGRVDAYVFPQASAEAEWVAQAAQRLHLQEGLPYRAMTVLVRSKRRFLPELSRALDRRGIPHDPPDTRLVDQPAVRMVLDCALAALHEARAPGLSEDAARAVRSLLLGPLFGLPLGRERDLLRQRRRTRRSWSDLLSERLP
ncbi:MAG: ATP-dependent helicase, partial [Acidimicrobiia bacterium]